MSSSAIFTDRSEEIITKTVDCIRFLHSVILQYFNLQKYKNCKRIEIYFAEIKEEGFYSISLHKAVSLEYRYI
jgi:hypothetical protein